MGYNLEQSTDYVNKENKLNLYEIHEKMTGKLFLHIQIPMNAFLQLQFVGKLAN